MALSFLLALAWLEERVGAQTTQTPDTTSLPSSVGDSLAAPEDALRVGEVTAAPGMTTMALSWGAVTGAIGYTVARATVGAQSFQALTAPINGTSFVDTGLSPGSTYRYVVQALWPDGRHGSSTPVNATTRTPENPRNFTVSESGHTVKLSWEAVPEASYYWLEGTGLRGQRVTDTTFVVHGLPPGTRSYALIAYYGDAADEANPSRATIGIWVAPTASDDSIRE